MIVVKILKVDGKPIGAATQGHSGLSEKGNDILCAACSTLVQTAYLAIADLGCKVCYERGDGMFEFRAEKSTHDVEVIIRAMCVGLKDLQSGYPQYLKLEE